MPCSVNHAALATKFCPTCGESTASNQPPAPPQWQQPPAAPQWQQPPAQPQWQQPPAPPQWQNQQQRISGPLDPNNLPAPLASRGKRLGGLALDALFLTLSLILLGLPYLIWLLIAMKDGQTPGKQLLKMRVYGTTTNQPVTWGHMAIRTILIPLVANAVYIPYWLSVISYGGLVSAITQPYYYGNSLYMLGLFLYFVIFVIDLVLFFTSPLNQRISDRWAKTLVLDETPRWGQRF